LGRSSNQKLFRTVKVLRGLHPRTPDWHYESGTLGYRKWPVWWIRGEWLHSHAHWGRVREMDQIGLQKRPTFPAGAIPLARARTVFFSI